MPESGAIKGVAAVAGGLGGRRYTADLRVGDADPVSFEIYRTTDTDQPWGIAADHVADTHHTLDELIYWNLLSSERHITEAMRRRILADFNEAP